MSRRCYNAPLTNRVMVSDGAAAGPRDRAGRAHGTGRADRVDRVDRLRVLLVDDEPDIVRAYQAALEDAGFAVSTARDGSSALDAVRFGRPDAVVVDLVMPTMTGWQFAEAVRSLPGEPCPVIAITAAGPGAVRSARDSEQFTAVLQKPVQLDELLSLLEMLLTN